MELAVPALLRALVAEHRTRIPQALCLPVNQAVLNAGTDTASRPFGPQGQAVAIAIRKSVHLLFNNICTLTDGTNK